MQLDVDGSSFRILDPHFIENCPLEVISMTGEDT